MKQSVGPESPWHVGATKQGSHFLLANANGALGTRVEGVRVRWHLLDCDKAQFAISLKVSAFGKFTCAINADARDGKPCHGEELVDQVLRLGATCGGLGPREIDAIHHDNQVIALLAATQRDAIGIIDMHPIPGCVQEARRARCCSVGASCLLVTRAPHTIASIEQLGGVREALGVRQRVWHAVMSAAGARSCARVVSVLAQTSEPAI